MLLNYADDSSKSSKSSRQVRVKEHSDEEEKYENYAIYTDGFIKKRQLNMNVAHFASTTAEGSGADSSSCESEADPARSEDSGGESVVSSDNSGGEVMLNEYMVNTSSNQG